MKVLLTGATGFIGTRTGAYLLDQGLDVRAALRGECSTLDERIESRITGELGPDTDWEPALAGMDAVVHLASRVHVMRETIADPSALFRKVNVEGTHRLAQMAAEAGGKRFVYLSSIKVNGEHTDGKAFRADDRPRPLDAYGQSKWEAEQALREIGERRGMEWVVIRPPLVYGAGVKGNLLRLIQLIQRGMPLPLAGIDNRRALVGRENLVSLIATCLQHPAAAGEVFLAGDARPLSTPELIRHIASALGTSERLFKLPTIALKSAATLLGRDDAWRRLAGSLEIDIDKARDRLGWTPPYGVERDIQAMATAFLAQND